MYGQRIPKYNTRQMGLSGLLTGMNEGQQQNLENTIAVKKLQNETADTSMKQKYYDALAQSAANRNPANFMQSIKNLQGMMGGQGGNGQMYVKSVGPNGPTFGFNSDDNLTAGQRLAKDKATQAIFDAIENNKVKRQQIADAEAALPNLSTGLLGSWNIKLKEMSGKPDQVLEDWQKVKAVLTDAQLMNTAKTKGAISDKEMELFAKAAANDDIQNVSRIVPILGKLKKFIDAQESAMVGAYKQNYGEDPMKWFANDIPSFNTEEEALASGVKGKVKIGGKDAEIS